MMYKKDYRRLWLFILLLSFLLAIAFEIIFIEHPSTTDDTAYMLKAQNLSPYGFVNPNHFNFRIGLLIPLKILIKIFGYSIFTYYLLAIGFSVLLFLVVLLLTKKLFGLRVAFISIILMLPSYIISYQSTNVFPDIPAFFWAVSSLYLFLIYLDNINNKYILLFSTFFGFLTYLTKLPVIVFLVTIPLIEYIKTKALHKTIKYIAIFAAFIVCEMIMYFLITGDPFIRFKIFMVTVDEFKVYLPKVTVFEYIFTSPINIFNLFSGKILIFGGLLGIIWAIIRRNFIVLSIFTGGLLLYILYTYSVVSFDPLIPSLPPWFRYIVGFLIVLNIISSWGIVEMSKFIRKKLKIKNINIILILFTTLLFIFEIRERLDNPFLVFFNQDSYFVPDRILKDKMVSDFDDTVYVPLKQVRDFRLFPNFNRLNIKSLNISDKFPKAPFYILYSRSAIRQLWSHADSKLWDDITNEKVLKYLNNFRFIYADQFPIIDYNGIVFSHITTSEIKYDTLFALDRMSNEKIFMSENKNLTFSLNNKSMVEIEFSKKTSKWSYFYTFSNKDELPKYNETKIPNLKPLRTYIVEISLNNKDYFDKFYINLSEYSSSKYILTHNISVSFLDKGDHQFHYIFEPSISTEKFKLTFQVKNLIADNKLLIKDIVIYSCVP